MVVVDFGVCIVVVIGVVDDIVMVVGVCVSFVGIIVVKSGDI